MYNRSSKDPLKICAVLYSTYPAILAAKQFLISKSHIKSPFPPSYKIPDLFLLEKAKWH
jgi:hypothetical protein